MPHRVDTPTLGRRQALSPAVLKPPPGLSPIPGPPPGLKPPPGLSPIPGPPPGLVPMIKPPPGFGPIPQGLGSLQTRSQPSTPLQYRDPYKPAVSSPLEMSYSAYGHGESYPFGSQSEPTKASRAAGEEEEPAIESSRREPQETASTDSDNEEFYYYYEDPPVPVQDLNPAPPSTSPQPPISPQLPISQPSSSPQPFQSPIWKQPINKFRMPQDERYDVMCDRMQTVVRKEFTPYVTKPITRSPWGPWIPDSGDWNSRRPPQQVYIPLDVGASNTGNRFGGTPPAMYRPHAGMFHSRFAYGFDNLNAGQDMFTRPTGYITNYEIEVSIAARKSEKARLARELSEGNGTNATREPEVKD